MALRHMSQKLPGELSTAKEICAIYKAPFDATSRMMQIMVQKGLLKSEHGAHGGYQIIKDLSEVSFLQLAEFILGPVNVADCLYQDEHFCELTATCNIISPVTRLNARMKEFYKNLSLYDLVVSENFGGKGLVETSPQFVV